jgi:PAS domain S-box-containing protein
MLVVGHSATAGWLLGWSALLLAALAFRAWVGWRHRSVGVPDNAATQWLLRHRAAFLLHGLIWATASTLFPPVLSAPQLELMSFALTALTAASLVVTAFDLTAAVCFGVPALLPLILALMLRGDPQCTLLAGMVVMFMVLIGLAAQRSQGLVRETVRARLAESMREAEARVAQQALQRQHQLLDQLMAGTDEGFWFIDNDGLTTDLNPAMCHLLGRTREEVLGKSVFTFFQADDLAVMQREIAARKGGQVRSAYEIGIQRPDGSRRYCLNRATALQDEQGQRMGSVGIWTDITARREAEQQLRLYERVTNSITDLVSVVDEKCVYIMVNDAWLTTSNLTREQVLGVSTHELMPAEEHQTRLAMLDESVRTGQPRQLTGVVHFRHAPARHIETTYIPMTTGAPGAAGVPAVAMVSRDVTDRERDRIALQDSEEDLRQTLCATDDAIFATDADGPDEPVRFNNPRMLELLGVTLGPGERLTPRLVMQHATAIFAEADEEVERIRQIIERQQVHVSRVPLKDGRVLLRRYAPAPVRGHTLRVWSFRDISSELRAVEVLERADADQRALLDAFPGFIGRLNQDLVYTYANKAYAAVVGRTMAQVVGHSAVEVLGAERMVQLQPLALRALAGEVVSYETHTPNPSGGPGLDTQNSLMPGRDPRTGEPMVFGFAVDISDRKRAERALIAARDEAERANRAKSQFLSQMSHELRTPMNAILGFGQLLESDPLHPLAAQQQRWLSEILNGARHLLNLINEVLDFGRIESGHLELKPEPLLLAHLVAEAQALVLPLAQGRQVSMLPGTGPLDQAWVMADRTRLLQILLNLLGNAIKYNRVGGHLQLACRVEATDVWLGVQDTGPGLAPEDQARLFQPFERLGAANSGVEGTGIGLALSQRLLQSMGGSIGLDSELGLGSTFWFRLPRASPPERRSASLASAHASPADLGGTQTVLYIEDNPVNVALMEAMLGRLSGVRLVSASVPAEGLRLAQQIRPALVLMDIQMPVMDGFEVLARLRADEATRDLPVVAVSANALPTDIEAARAAGFLAYLTKPLSLDVLLTTVRQVLRGATVD